MQVAGCENHPAREAIGLCVKCRRRVCGECATKIEGINYCVSCLSGLAAAGGRSPGGDRASAASTSSRAVHAVLALQVLVLTLVLFGILQLLLPS
jgi:hypothetical protein